MSKITKNLSITYQLVSDLKPDARNARTHPEWQLKKLENGMEAYGFTNPILVDEKNVIIAGHGRLEAAKRLGLEEVPTIRLEHLSEKKKRALRIADNKLSELGGWNEEILKIELEFLSKTDLDLTLTGFELPAIDLILQKGVKQNKDDEFEVSDKLPRITKFGDLWELGPHRILCGDALEEISYLQLLAGEKAQLVISDFPYNLPIPGHVSGLGQAQHENFAMACGEMSEAEFTNFLKKAMTLAASYSLDGSIHYGFMDWRHLGELISAGKQSYSELKNICIWNKTNAGMGSLYRSKYEAVGVFKNGTAPHINNIQLGKHGRYRTNVWDYAGQTSPHANREEELAMHPTVKPVAMVADAILDCSHRNGLVLDPFGGSGTTLIAAENTGRRARLIEIDPLYVDTTIRRWQKLTGKKAQHCATNALFDA